MRRHDSGAGCGARGQASQACTREAPAKPSAGTKTGCLQWLDAAGAKGGGSCPDEGTQEGPAPVRKHGAGDLKSRMWSAAGRPPFAKGGHASQGVDEW